MRRRTNGTSPLMETPAEQYGSFASLPRSYLRPCLLLLLAEDSSHGYELLEQLRELGLRIAEPGGMYRALRSMDEDGLVRSWWEPSQSGPARRLYVITDEGRASLKAWIGEIIDTRRRLDELVQRHEGISRPNRRPRP